jgi:hypothetical protein
VVLDLFIPPEEYQRLYQGVARVVHARARDGRRIQFPALILQRFLTRNGIHGTFEIQFDESYKFAGIRKLG